MIAVTVLLLSTALTVPAAAPAAPSDQASAVPMQRHGSSGACRCSDRLPLTPADSQWIGVESR